MKKIALQYSIDSFILEYPEYENCNVEFYISVEIIDDIIELLTGDFRSKFWTKLHYILKGEIHRSGEHYLKLQGYDNIYEIRFTGTKNLRIYCKEYREKGKTRIIIMAKMIFKKTQKLEKRIKKLIKPIEQTTYELRKKGDKGTKGENSSS